MTGIAEWRKRRDEGQEVRLPSGNVARLRRVHILDLAEQGAIPAPLAGLVSQMTRARKTTIDMEEMGEYLGLVNLVVKASFTEPPVGDEATETQLGVDEISTVDRLAVFAWNHPEGEQFLRGFRAKQARVVDAAQSGKRLRGAAQRVSGG